MSFTDKTIFFLIGGQLVQQVKQHDFRGKQRR